MIKTFKEDIENKKIKLIKNNNIKKEQKDISFFIYFFFAPVLYHNYYNIF